MEQTGCSGANRVQWSNQGAVGQTNPSLRKLERIQRRATKMIPELRDLSYESRLLQCGLTTLETRRLRGDQIEVFKIVNGYEDVDRNMFFKLKEGS